MPFTRFALLLLLSFFAIGVTACGGQSAAGKTPQPIYVPTPQTEDIISPLPLGKMVKWTNGNMLDASKTQAFGIFLPESSTTSTPVVSDTVNYVFGLWEFDNDSGKWRPLLVKSSPPGLQDVQAEFRNVISTHSKVLVVQEFFESDLSRQNLLMYQYLDDRAVDVLEMSNLLRAKMTYKQEALAVSEPLYSDGDNACCPSKVSIKYYSWDGYGFAFKGGDQLPVVNGKIPEPDFRHVPPPEGFGYPDLP